MTHKCRVSSKDKIKVLSCFYMKTHLLAKHQATLKVTSLSITELQCLHTITFNQDLHPINMECHQSFQWKINSHLSQSDKQDKRYKSIQKLKLLVASIQKAMSKPCST